jgi:hypothetical protein
MIHIPTDDAAGEFIDRLAELQQDDLRKDIAF